MYLMNYKMWRSLAMASNKNSQNLLNKNDPYTLLSSGIVDRSIILALLSLVLLSWFINSFLIA